MSTTEIQLISGALIAFGVAGVGGAWLIKQMDTSRMQPRRIEMWNDVMFALFTIGTMLIVTGAFTVGGPGFTGQV